jgi:hypothetical protein
MRKLAIHGIPSGRVRGLSRKCRAMVESITAIAGYTPVEHSPGCGYWHAHLPVAQAFIDSPATPRSVRRLCIQSILDASERLRLAQSSRRIDCRVVASIDLPKLWNSQIIVFFGQNYFSRFFQRDMPEQTWGLPAAPTVDHTGVVATSAGRIRGAWFQRDYH